MSFGHPIFILVALLLLALAVFKRINFSIDSWRSVMSKAVHRYLGANQQTEQSYPVVLLCAAVVALALSSPAIKTNDHDTLQHSNGWIIVADVSRSMTADDIAPNRFSAMRNTLAKLAEESAAKPIALLIYAGDAFVAVPTAFDKTLFTSHSNLLEYGVVPVDGSNLARALSLASSVIADSGFASARVLLLTDSGGMNASSEAAARYIVSSGHRLDVLLFGSSRDANADTQSNLRVDLAQAESIAEAGGGIVVRANSLGDINFSALELDTAEHTTQNAYISTLYWRNQSHWILLFGVGPLLLWAFRRTLS